MQAAGLRLGLGTDGVSSTPSYDFFDEMRTFSVIGRGRMEQAGWLDATEVLEFATLGSARVLGLDAEIGSLKEGKRADLAVVSLAGSPYHPWEDPAAAVVFGGTPERVLLSVVNGEERYRKGVTDWHELSVAATGARSRLLGLSASVGASARPSSRR
jgi:5-methylthioadenosine/S-adenosylhomocysteine deaminase